DGDGSDDPGELARVVAPIVEDRADLVVGSRVLGGHEPGSLTPAQRFGNALATRLLAVMFGARYTDLGPFRAARWSALASLRMRDRDYGWTVEMQARAARAGLRGVEVPVRWRRRAGGRSKVSGTVRGASASAVCNSVNASRIIAARSCDERVTACGIPIRVRICSVLL